MKKPLWPTKLVPLVKPDKEKGAEEEEEEEEEEEGGEEEEEEGEGEEEVHSKERVRVLWGSWRREKSYI